MAKTDSSSEPTPHPANGPKRSPLWKWILGVLVVLGLFLAIRQLPLNAWLQTFNAWVAEIGLIGYVVFIVVYIVAAVLFIPGSALTLGAGFAFGLLKGVIAVSIASTTAAAAAFLIGRYFLRERFTRQFEDSRRFKAIDQAIGREGGKIVLLLRLTPVMPFSLGNYLFGLTAVRFWHYVLASWIGMIPGTILYVYLGTFGKAGLEAAAGEASTGRLIVQGIALVAIVAVTVLITRIARKALKEAELGERAKEELTD